MSKNKINNNKFNTIDNSSNIIQNNQISNFSNHKKQFSFENNNLNKNQILNKNNIDNIKESNNNKKFLKSNDLSFDTNFDNNNSLNNNASKNKILFSSNNQQNFFSKNKYKTIDNDVDINNKKSNVNILSNQLIDDEIIADYKLNLNKKFPEARNTYYGINTKSKEEVAIKREFISTKNPTLAFEKYVYRF